MRRAIIRTWITGLLTIAGCSGTPRSGATAARPAAVVATPRAAPDLQRVPARGRYEIRGRDGRPYKPVVPARAPGGG